MICRNRSWRTLGVAVPGSGGLWEWWTLGVAGRHPAFLLTLISFINLFSRQRNNIASSIQFLLTLFYQYSIYIVVLLSVNQWSWDRLGWHFITTVTLLADAFWSLETIGSPVKSTTQKMFFGDLALWGPHYLIRYIPLYYIDYERWNESLRMLCTVRVCSWCVIKQRSGCCGRRGDSHWPSAGRKVKVLYTTDERRWEIQQAFSFENTRRTKNGPCCIK